VRAEDMFTRFDSIFFALSFTSASMFLQNMVELVRMVFSGIDEHCGTRVCARCHYERYSY